MSSVLKQKTEDIAVLPERAWSKESQLDVVRVVPDDSLGV